MLRNGETAAGRVRAAPSARGRRAAGRAGVREINQLLALEGVALMRAGGERSDRDIETERDALVEAVIAPDSQRGGQTIEEVNFPGRFGAQVLALRQHGELQQEDLLEAVLGGGNSVIFLLAGVIPLGVALESTGGAALIADRVVNELRCLGPTAVLGAFFVMTQLFTSVISNNATAALFAPIAIGAADTLNVDARPFLFAITVAASMSFLTPIGYQTNTMIYGPAEFRFSDFTRIGAPLTLLVAVVATLLIPQIWSF